MIEQTYEKLKSDGWGDKTIEKISKIIEAQNKFHVGDNVVLDTDFSEVLNELQLKLGFNPPTKKRF
jgi:hypothetical protein